MVAVTRLRVFVLLALVGATASLATLAAAASSADPADETTRGRPAARDVGAPSVPRPTGSLPVGTETLTLVDPTRQDPFASRRERRRILAQVYFPAVDRSRPRARYMPGGVANALASATVPAPVLRSIATHSQFGARARRGRYPVLVFSPGYSVPHYLYTGLLEDLASHGYVVVAIDHTRETEAVQFSDGQTIRRTLPDNPRNILKPIQARIDDVAFVVETLESLRRRATMIHADTAKVGLLGHSLGGLTAANVAAENAAIGCAADIAGSVYGRALQTPFRRPFLIIDGSQRESTLARWWANLRGVRYWVTLTTAKHLNFTDWSWLTPALAARGLTPRIQDLGRINGTRALSLERRYVTSFFDECLKHRPSTVFDSGAPEPDVRIKR